MPIGSLCCLFLLSASLHHSLFLWFCSFHWGFVLFRIVQGEWVSEPTSPNPSQLCLVDYIYSYEGLGWGLGAPRAVSSLRRSLSFSPSLSLSLFFFSLSLFIAYDVCFFVCFVVSFWRLRLRWGEPSGHLTSPKPVLSSSLLYDYFHYVSFIARSIRHRTFPSCRKAFYDFFLSLGLSGLCLYRGLVVLWLVVLVVHDTAVVSTCCIVGCYLILVAFGCWIVCWFWGCSSGYCCSSSWSCWCFFSLLFLLWLLSCFVVLSWWLFFLVSGYGFCWALLRSCCGFHIASLISCCCTENQSMIQSKWRTWGTHKKKGQERRNSGGKVDTTRMYEHNHPMETSKRT